MKNKRYKMKKIALFILCMFSVCVTAMEKSEDISEYDKREERVTHRRTERRKRSVARVLFKVAPSIMKKRRKVVKASRKVRNLRFEANKENIAARSSLNLPFIDPKVLLDQLNEELTFGEGYTSEDPSISDSLPELAPQGPNSLALRKMSLDRAAQGLFQ